MAATIRDLVHLPDTDRDDPGPDLEYSPEFGEMVRLLQPEETVVGGEVFPGGIRHADYGAARRLALSLLVRSRDLRLAAYYGHASLGLEDLDGYMDAIDYTKRCIERHWEALHPALDEDDPDDDTARWSAVSLLVDGEAVRWLFRAVPIAEPVAGMDLSLRDIEFVEADYAPEDRPAGTQDMAERLAGMNMADVEDTFSATRPRKLRARYHALREIADDLAWLARRAEESYMGFRPNWIGREVQASIRVLDRALSGRW